jgi:hypothetical protein
MRVEKVFGSKAQEILYRAFFKNEKIASFISLGGRASFVSTCYVGFTNRIQLCFCPVQQKGRVQKI